MLSLKLLANFQLDVRKHSSPILTIKPKTRIHDYIECSESYHQCAWWRQFCCNFLALAPLFHGRDQDQLSTPEKGRRYCVEISIKETYTVQARLKFRQLSHACLQHAHSHKTKLFHRHMGGNENFVVSPACQQRCIFSQNHKIALAYEQLPRSKSSP